MQIAVIGAGLAGVVCARELQAQGHMVTVYEKSEHPSGRMSTDETQFGGFDRGAQYFTCTSEAFKKEVATWKKAAVVDVWNGKLVNLKDGKASSSGRSRQRYVAQPGMGALGEYLAKDLNLHTEQLVTEIKAFGNSGQWLLTIASNTVPIAAHGGPFDAVIVAVPADQARPLLACAPKLEQEAAKLHLAPCWALELAFQLPLELGYDGAFVEGSRLAFIAHDNSKPGHRPGERWVAHASSAWSIEHLEDDPERAREKLLKAFHEATGSPIQPIFSQAYRWRFAQALEPLNQDCLWQEELNIGACGDWFAAGLEGSGKIENAWLSGHQLARSIGPAK